MDRGTLFKNLAEHYVLEPDKDWWQHRQSGKWVLTHAAVQKIANQPTPEGNIITFPGRADIDWIKKGDVTEGGIHGPEVVIGAEFCLKTSDGKIIRKVYAVGEANPSNVNKSLAYPWAMAWKRMFDRGVLDVLAFASHGFYSAEEADTFSDPSQRVSVKQEVAPTPVPRAPQPRAPQVASSTPTPRAPAPRPPAPKKVEAQGDDELIRFVTASGIVSKGDICGHMGWEPTSFLSRINPLVESGVLIRTGQKRGTRYSLPTREVASEKEVAPLTKQEYHTVWRDVSDRLRSFGMSQLIISRLVREVTGHETAISAHQNGALTQESVDKIFALGQRWMSANNGRV
jgi:hypothetical protein